MCSSRPGLVNKLISYPVPKTIEPQDTNITSLLEVTVKGTS